MKDIEINKADIAASFQKAIIDVLQTNLFLTCERRGIKKIAVAGGVASNSCLRETLQREGHKRGIEILFPSPILCTDNAAMIGSAAYFNYKAGIVSNLDINAKPNLKLGEM
jgi:N6-L-threonylcarbamoyladenine synthase